MKTKIVLLLLVTLTNQLYSAKFDTLKAQETYIRLDPRNQYVEIIEYNLLSKHTKDKKIKNDLDLLIHNIKESTFAKKKFSFNFFEPLEEKVINEGKYLKGSYYLYTQEKDIRNLLKDVFGKILGRDIDVEITNKNINIIFIAKGYTLGTNNAEGIYGKDDKALISWKNGTPTFELVFRINPINMTPLIKYQKSDVFSPVLTKEQVDELKFGSPELPKSFQGFQDDADIYRLRHIKYYGELLEKYYKKTGKYPFQGEEKLPIYVFIANDKQEEYTKDENPQQHKVYTLKSFIKELENELGEKIHQYYDPQFKPNKKPNYYMYMIRDNQYFFAVHTSRYKNFTTKVADNYYKVEISNKKLKGTNILTLDELVSNAEFNEIINSKPVKEGLFIEREEEYINFIK